MGLLGKLRRRFGPQDRVTNELQTRVPTFYPASLNYWDFEYIAYQAADMFPQQIISLMGSDILREVNSSESVFRKTDQALDALFGQFGSDKATLGYGRVYGTLLNDWGDGDGKSILEIGLGTNDPKAISSMGKHGHPGASLRAFAARYPKARVYGADIDRSILFTEDRISTSFVDQLKPNTFADMHKGFGLPHYDLVIDDGLHCSSANINTLLFFISISKENSVFIVEDIPDRTLPVWAVTSSVLKYRKYDCQIVSTGKSNVFVLRV